MERQNLPNKLSEEELLELLTQEENSKEKSSESLNKIISFLRFYNIEPGNNPIKKKTLLNLYKKYSKKAMPKREFTNGLLKYLVQKTYKMEEYILINKKAMDLDEEILKFIEEKKRPQTKRQPRQRHFQNFIEKFSLEAGKRENSIWVSSDILYNLYDEWVYRIKRKYSFSKREFINFCMLYFKDQKENETTIWFLLNDSISTVLTSERISKLKARNSLNEEKKKSKK